MQRVRELRVPENYINEIRRLHSRELRLRLPIAPPEMYDGCQQERGLPTRVAYTGLFDRLGELDVGHTVALALDDSKGTHLGVVAEDHEVGGVLRRADWDGHPNANAGKFRP